MTPEMAALKTRLKTTWMAGDYGTFARFMESGALEFLHRLNLTPGIKLLDVGCGSGQIAIPAALAGVEVTGVDIATNLLEQARERAQHAGLRVQFEEGDAEALPFPDGSFEVVVSLIGAMFAPRPDLVAAELVRVCRPGGRIVMANWTPEGFVGQMFKTIARHVPPPPLMASPVLWGKEDVVKERFSQGIASLQLEKQMFPFSYPFPPAEVVEFYRTYYGPTNRAFAALDETGQLALRNDLEHLWSTSNQAADGHTSYPGEYLKVTAIKEK
ncbi:MAG: class I SAM-dependent methyltransferase [Blastocatellia bacterium]|nr:class I SAM-dependent methyltransferase [Blastocatellia bacterium]